LRDLVPPAFAEPFLPLRETHFNLVLLIIEENRSAVMEYVEKRVVIEDMDRRAMWAVMD
jgi:hypothetical protein